MTGVGEERALSATTTGEVVSGETESLAAGGKRCDGTVVYDVDGAEYQINDRTSGPCPADDGESAVQVRYDPSSPHAARAGDSDEGPLGLAICAALAAALLLTLLARSLVARRRDRRSGDANGPAPSTPRRRRAGGRR